MSGAGPAQLHQLLDKMSNPDSDFRFMSLNDLLEALTSSNFNFAAVDSHLQSKLIEGVVKALDDQNGEVQNLAVKCLGPLVLKVKESYIAPLMDRLLRLSMEASDASIPSTALRTIVTNLPRPPSSPSNTASTTSALNSTQTTTAAAQSATPQYSEHSIRASTKAVQQTLLPNLMQLLKPGEPGKPGGATLDSIDLLIETVRCFGMVLGGPEVEKAQVVVMNLLENERTPGVIKKRAVTALSLLCVYAPDELLSQFISHLIESFRTQGQYENVTRLRLLVSITGALARGIPERFGPYLKQLCPFVLSIVNGKDLDGEELGEEPSMERDEVREAALVALESFQSCCTEEMNAFIEELITAGTIYLKYDPNYADQDEDEDDEAMGGTQGGEDDDDGDFGGNDEDDEFEDDGNFTDEDDISWKVRRCAAKLLATVINTRAKDLIRGRDEKGGTAYTRLAPLLISRFNEREENVRLEVLATATSLIDKTGEVAATVSNDLADKAAMPPPPKPRRGSDASMLDSFAVPETPVIADESGVRSALAGLVPRISKSLGKLLNNKTTTLPTKQASITLLSSLVTVLNGGLGDALIVFLNAVVEMVKGSNLSTGGGVVVATAQGGSAATATGSSVRIEALRLLTKIFENHSAKVVAPYLDTLVPAISAAVNEHGYKLSFEALGTVAAFVKLLADDGETESFAEPLRTLYDAVVSKVESADTDLEVREKAILTLGAILSRTTTSQGWIGADLRQRALDLLLERLKNETTRVTAARAIDAIAKNVAADEDVSGSWLEAVVNECGGQLRKANRILRATSLETLRSIAVNDITRSKLGAQLKKDLVATLTPLLVVGDMQLLAAAVAIMKYMMLNPTDDIHVTKDVADGICNLVKSSIGSGVVLENLLSLVATVGEVDTSGKKTLMTGLLQNVGVTGETTILAKVVAQLLVSGGGDSGGFGVTINDFVQEVENSRHDEKRRSLALMILGEIGLRMGSTFPVAPAMFLANFHSTTESIPLAAAVALGLAGAGNSSVFVPEILNRLDGGQDSYLLVHSLKEVIQHSPREALTPFASQLWTKLLSTAVANEDSKAAAAECVGRLTVLDPYTFLPELQTHLRSPDVAVRGLSISALRFTFTDTDATYDELLRPIVVDFLAATLDDSDLENRRLALTALNSAASNKSHLLAPGLPSLLPKVYVEATPKPELIREIQMGPFRHKVDDGLELRKSAYETLYSLLETSFPALDLPTYFERVLAGLTDASDIRALACLMLGRLCVAAPGEVLARLEGVQDAMRRMLTEKPKDNAVKQEIERHKEGVRGVVKVAVQVEGLVRESGRGGGVWGGFWEWLNSGFVGEVRAVEERGRGE